MEKEQRSMLQKATQDARRLLEEEFRSQLLQTYDIDVEKVRWAEEPGAHLQAEQRLIREKLVAWIEHRSAQINEEKEALLLTLREMAFTALNRFVALKLMEARELVRPCVSGGLESEGFQEFTAVAQGLLADQESSYRLYLETIFEDVSRELRALFDPRDPASLLWPKRTALLELLEILNRPELAELWIEDETLGWVYQYFNGDAERKKMREESSAPRNSRELAVRNQFFTPRYVVEFLTDNTLGRIWYEMRQGNTGLKDRCRYLVRRPNEIWLQLGEEPPEQPNTDEALSQEELLRQPVYIPHRPLKDPREIRMLDPACGSMHFGLYAFDLYLEIYKEAWEIAQDSDEQPKQEVAFSPFVAYAAGFADKSAFLREVPKLILQHNIHGIDIDPRATQIARLTLWLRAQRAWKEQHLQVVDRSAITRSNVVCAEPMPGERELLADFVDEQFSEAERGLIQQLLETIFDKMQLAGEAGALLRIEEEIRDAIVQARKEWLNLSVHQKGLFSPSELAALGQVGSSLITDLQSLTKDFWTDIEERIYVALSEYAKQADSGGGYQRRLFAEDAAQGFAFLDICRKRYDAVLMNPPFGDASSSVANYCISPYPTWGSNLLCAFFSRAWSMSRPNGSLGCIFDRTAAVKSSYEAFRQDILLSSHKIHCAADTGWEVLDANVETFCLNLSSSAGTTLAPFIDLRSAAPSDKRNELLRSIAACSRGDQDSNVRLADTSAFEKLPNAVIGYDLPEFLLDNLSAHGSLEENDIKAYQGHALEAAVHYRTWWEVGPWDRSTWVYAFKGGEFSPYYISHTDVAKYGINGSLVPEKSSNVLRSTSKHGLPGVAFGKRGEFLDAQPLAEEQIFTHEGHAMPGLDPSQRWAVLALLNSRLFSFGINTYCGQHKTSGYVNLFPYYRLDSRDLLSLEELAKSIHRIKLEWYRGEETDPYFVLSFILLHGPRKAVPLGAVIDNLYLRIRSYTGDLRGLDLEIEEIVQSAYNLSPRDRDDLSIRSRGRPDLVLWHDRGDLDQEKFAREVIGDFISYLTGCVFGRWDIRYASGEMLVPELPDPFSPLPVCPPGMLKNSQGLPAEMIEVPSSYSLRISWSGILVDDESHPEDIVTRIRESIARSLQGNADDAEQDACVILGAQNLREYLRRPSNFFAAHLNRYTRSRRQAPIYWQLSAGSGTYSAWLYYHRFTQDTLYRVLRDFVEPRIQQAEREQFELESQGALSGDAATRLQETQTLLQDLRILKSELDLVAPLWNPNLNDGVIIIHAILWRITPYTPWQKKCKECWGKLVKGDYDWAHLAFHLWPERVIPKCITDRSLAIAHGLEERLWQETNNGNWLPRQLSESDLQALIAEHSNPAVKNALERFLAAPPPVAPTRTRAPRATRSTASGTTRKPRGSTAVVDAEATRQTLLVLTAAPAEGLSRNAIAELLGVEADSLTAVIKQLKATDQIEQLGAARGARYRLTEKGRAAVASQAGEDD